jgi:superfamily II DNA or RNA helicase
MGVHEEEDMELRQYQQDAITAVHAAWQHHHDVLGVAATGAGKTVIFTKLLTDVLRSGGRAVILAHREELITQPLERLRAVASDWLEATGQLVPRVGILMGERKEYDRQLTIATVQTLGYQRDHRCPHLDKLLAHGPIDYLITDEAHHAIAPAYLRVRDGLRAANAEMRHLGVTATPMRGDELGLANTFSTTAFTISIADLVRQGYLVAPRWLAISTQIDLTGVRSAAGDYQSAQLAERFDTAACRALVIAAHREYGAGRPAIAFTASVKGAHELADAFTAAGFPAASADGTTDKAVRRGILDDFRNGKYEVLVNCGLWTEGLDVPEIACIHLARPTRSDGLYIQMVGRGLRPTTSKTDCLILDYLPADARNVAMLGDILGCPIPREELLKKFSGSKEPGVTQVGFTFDGDDFHADGLDLQIVARELQYLEQSPFVWHRRDGLLTLGCGRGNDNIERILAIQDNQLYAIWRTAGGPWVARQIACNDAFGRGEQLAAKHASKTLAAKGSGWHARACTDAQARYLKTLAGRHMTRNEIAALSSGTAANLITHYQALNAIASIREEVAA